ncbi:amidase, partial [Pseudomonas sp. GW460-13]
MGVGGPLARSPRDLELALDVLVAPSELDQTAWRVAIPPSRHQRLQDFRVGLWADAFAVDGGCLEAMEAYA